MNTYNVPPDGVCTKADGKHIYSDGKVEYYQNGLLHRLPDPNKVVPVGCFNDYPAVETKEGEYYYKEGKLHRDGDEPAVITNDYAQWYKDGLLHRLGNQPAHEGYSNHLKKYAINGKYHRTDGPAVIIGNNKYTTKGVVGRGNAVAPPDKDGLANKLWMVDGKLHRNGGPAVECSYGRQEYFQNGVYQGAGMKTYQAKELAPDGKPWRHVLNLYGSDEEFGQEVFGPFMHNPDSSSVVTRSLKMI